MAHMMKFTRGSAGTMTRHFERAKNQNGEYLKFGNQDIDISKTQENYNLNQIECSQLDFIKQRLEKDDIFCLNRKDVNIMCSWIITAPKNLEKKEQIQFFEESYKFLCNRYGIKNCISAYVHMDETTPHIHFAFMPIIWDEKKQRETVSAKKVLNRADLKSFHNDLENHMANVFSRTIGIINESTKNGNKAIEELKRKSAKERLIEIQEITKKNIIASQEKLDEANVEASKIVQKANEELKQVKSKLRTLEAEYKAKKAYIKGLVNQKGIYDGVITKKSITGKIKYELTPEKFEEISMTYMDKIEVQKMQENIEKTVENYKQGTEYKNFMNMKTKFENEIKKLKKINENLKKNNNELINNINRVNKVFKIKPEIEKQFYIAEKEIQIQEQQQRKSMNWDMER